MSVDDWGIKISKAGASTDSTDPRDLLMSSKYGMLKYHSVQDTTITFHPGDIEQYADITHGVVDSDNNAYTPAFIPYAQDLDDPDKLRFIGASPPTDLGLAYWAYSTATKIRMGLTLIGFIYNGYDSSQSQGGGFPPETDWYDEHFDVTNEILVGKKTGNVRNGALRFADVFINNAETIVSATINYAVQFTAGSGAGDMKIKTYGIAEDNTGAFSSNPMGRTKTSANTAQNVASLANNSHFGINVTSQVQEIINRAGWASGNHLGFLIFDNGSPDGAWAEDDASSGIDSYLTITYGGNITLKFRAIIFKDKIA